MVRLCKVETLKTQEMIGIKLRRDVTTLFDLSELKKREVNKFINKLKLKFDVEDAGENKFYARFTKDTIILFGDLYSSDIALRAINNNDYILVFKEEEEENGE
jgi:hypothetical protein